MKKFFVTILAIVYITTSTGASIHMHYCMGKLAEWKINGSKSKNCGRCGMEMSSNEDNGCCKDENKYFKNDKDQKAPGNGFQLLLIEKYSIPVSFFEIASFKIISFNKEYPSIHAPPRSCGVAVYIRNRTFLI